jgi:hypothetical protein
MTLRSQEVMEAFIGSHSTGITPIRKFRGVALWFYDVNQALPGFNANLALKARVEGKK